jgi:ribonuclease BN (tRNA processing enzyme)
VIIFEVVERNAKDVFINAPVELINKTHKTKKYLYNYLDLIMGNNLKYLNESKLYKRKNTSVYGKHTVEKEAVWFINNRLTHFTNFDEKNIISSMQLISQKLKADNIKIIYLIAPDKESLYPNIFGKSNLEKLQFVMRKNGIDFIDMYTYMLNKGKNFYYLGDTHWNQNAINLLTDQVFDKLSNPKKITNID